MLGSGLALGAGLRKNDFDRLSQAGRPCQSRLPGFCYCRNGLLDFTPFGSPSGRRKGRGEIAGKLTAILSVARSQPSVNILRFLLTFC